MKKTLIALAALAATGVVSAQSSVTLSGIMKVGVASTSYSPVAAGTTKSNLAMQDGSSRFILSGTEDLGGGMAAMFQIDTRFRLDDNGAAPASGPIGAGNTFVGLRGGFGMLQLGKLDTHYCSGGDAHGGSATALTASNCALQGYVNGNAAGRSVAVTSRSVNVIRYTTPNMSGFTGVFSFSPNAYGNEQAINAAAGAANKSGKSINLALTYAQGPISAGFSYWDHTSVSAAAIPDQSAYTLYGAYDLGVARIGLTYDNSELENIGAVAGANAKRSFFAIPVTVPVGSGTIVAAYSRASDAKGLGAGTGANTGASQFSIGYVHNLSKRTSLGVSYVALNNDTAASYALYTGGALGNLAAPAAGQDQKSFYVGVRHTF